MGKTLPPHLSPVAADAVCSQSPRPNFKLCYFGGNLIAVPLPACLTGLRKKEIMIVIGKNNLTY